MKSFYLMHGMLSIKSVAAIVTGLFTLCPMVVCGQNYVRPLVSNLLAIGYPITGEDVVDLDKTAMRFDSRNRLDVLKKILSDREVIHNMPNAPYFSKTEAICSALRLLDEHNLPETNALIASLSESGGWEKRERELLAYMAAKRGMNYDANVAYLLESLAQYRNFAENRSDVEVSVAILDLCNLLSYLSGIVNHTGDVDVLVPLIRYVSQAYGYPAEYASRLLVDMFLHQPAVFVPVLSETDNRTRKRIIDLMVFGIWNNQQKGNVLETIRSDLRLEDAREKETIALFTEKIRLRFPDAPPDEKEPAIEAPSAK